MKKEQKRAAHSRSFWKIKWRRPLIGFALGCVHLGLVACTSEDPSPAIDDPRDRDVALPDAAADVFEEEIQCTGLFGVPGSSTGLGEDECGPRCFCGDQVWEVRDYDEDFIADLRRWTLVEGPQPLNEDPYQTDVPPTREDGHCGMVILDDAQKTYRLETFPSRPALDAAGAFLTHEQSCGLCSSLEDLAVYIETPDLTGPVRTCGLRGLRSEADQLRCIEDLGFSSPCAQIWSYNTTHTRQACLDICLPLMNAPHNEPDGSMNPCLACDEEKSGPVFQAIAGRTRRNSGLPSGICRPCEDLARHDHVYGP